MSHNTHVDKLCNFKTNMHESSCQSKIQVEAIWNFSSGELYGPLASYYFLLATGCHNFNHF